MSISSKIYDEKKCVIHLINCDIEQIKINETNGDSDSENNENTKYINEFILTSIKKSFPE